MEIRAYEDPDQESVTKLWREVFSDSSSWNIPEEDIERKLAIQRELFLVAVTEGEVVGTAMGGYDGHRGWIYYVAVLPEFRRIGIGSALMAKLENELNKLGCPKINLQVRASNEVVISFYKKLGYEVEDRVSMGKRL
ncbi:MAG: GNAT family acetyltransferase [Anaerolineales bacterium]|nr:GNAT family acetyltransferase [Anaerolineales bacterium]